MGNWRRSRQSPRQGLRTANEYSDKGLSDNDLDHSLRCVRTEPIPTVHSGHRVTPSDESLDGSPIRLKTIRGIRGGGPIRQPRGQATLTPCCGVGAPTGPGASCLYVGGNMSFRERLMALGFATYDAYLNGPHWKDIKKRWKESGRPMLCDVCNEGPIHLHHHNYSRLGQESLDDIDPLCRRHHEQVHEFLKHHGPRVNRTAKAIAYLKSQLNQPVLASEAKPSKKTPKERRRCKTSSCRNLPKRGKAYCKWCQKANRCPSLLPSQTPMIKTKEEKIAELTAKEFARTPPTGYINLMKDVSTPNAKCSVPSKSVVKYRVPSNKRIRKKP